MVHFILEAHSKSLLIMLTRVTTCITNPARHRRYLFTGIYEKLISDSQIQQLPIFCSIRFHRPTIVLYLSRFN